MADDEKLTSAEVDVRNQAMVQDLQHMYAPTAEDQSLERMRNRLLATKYTSVQTSGQHGSNSYNERFRPMDSMQTRTIRPKGWYLNVLVASLIAVLIIGSLLLVVAHVYSSNTGGARPSHISGARVTATVTAIPQYSSDWRLLASFDGMGSEIIIDQHLSYNHALGVWFTCTGKGATSVRLNTASGRGFQSTCHAEAAGTFNYKVISGNSAGTIAKIYVVAAKTSTWKLQLAGCIGYVPNCEAPIGAPVPTPTPIPMQSGSYPTPTPSGSYPTPTPSGSYPTPTPSGSYPTPTPAG
jgi:hypothetical protein